MGLRRRRRRCFGRFGIDRQHILNRRLRSDHRNHNRLNHGVNHRNHDRLNNGINHGNHDGLYHRKYHGINYGIDHRFDNR